MKIINMRVNHIDNPLGFEMKSATFSWVTEDCTFKCTSQKYVQIIVALDNELKNRIYDSGMRTDISSLGFTPDLMLKPRTRYYWQVTITADNDEKVISDISWFETDKMHEQWQGIWITPCMDSDTHPLLRKEFILPDNIKKARLYASGLGLYYAYINGEKAGNEYFTPGFTSYDSYVQYQTYDITDSLKTGKNVIGLSLGNGWYKGRFGFDGGYTNLYGDKFAAIAEIIVTLSDDREIIIPTDTSWKCNSSPVTFSGIYDGEIYDSTKEIKNWHTESYDDSDWRPVEKTEIKTKRLDGRLSLPVKIKEEIKPVEAILTSKNEVILDFGQNITGWVKFNVKNSIKGQKVLLQYSEILQNDCFYRDNLRTAEAKYTYICSGEDMLEIQPGFTYFGFRYVKVEGLGKEINKDDFTACSIYSDLEITGNIETSDKNVNRLFKNALWSQKDNFLDVPTDCPQRDERMGWTGDAQIFANTACYNMYAPAFYKKFMKNLYSEQRNLNGSVPFTVPMIKPENADGFVNGNGSAAWSDAAAIIPWVLYQQYGDKTMLESQFDSMREWVDYVKEVDDKTGSTRLWNHGFQFGDWLALDSKNEEDLRGGTEETFIASAYYYYSASLVAKAADVIGKHQTAEEYKKLADEIKNAIRNEYFTASGRCAINTQTALIVSLYMNLANDKKRIAKDLEKLLLEDNVHLTTGFVGTPYFCHALSDNNLNEYAYALLLNDDFPSWLYEVKMGATTIWERWNSVLPDGSISGTGMNSLNHYAYGSIVEWMYSTMLGIKNIETSPGFKRFILSPKPDKAIKYAKGEVKTASGLIKSSWKIGDDGKLSFTFEVPFDTSAKVVLPDAQLAKVYLNGAKILGSNDATSCQEEDNTVCVVKSGKYTFEYMPEKDYLMNFSGSSKLIDVLKCTKAREILYKAVPPLRNNSIILQNLNDNIGDLYRMPILCKFLSKDIMNKAVEELERCSL